MACESRPEGYEIKGTISGDIENGSEVYLKKSNEFNRMENVDTTTVDNGVFVFSGEMANPELHYVFFEKLQGNIPVIVENGSIELTAHKDSLTYSKLEGTLQNELFANFLKGSRALANKANSMRQDMQKATAQRDTVIMNSIAQEYQELQVEAKSFELDYAKENPNALIAALIIEKAMNMRAIPENEIKELYEALTPEIKETPVGMRIKEQLEKSEKTTIGAKAPNFTAPTPSGEELALNDVLGKVTIVDFWAAWCKPCRAENPNVVQVYKKYKEKGLSILGVSLDRRAEDWKKAIEDDGLEWNHVSNVDYFDEIAQLYNVNAIPAMFVLDEDGVIVAKNLRGPALEAKISEMLP